MANSRTSSSSLDTQAVLVARDVTHDRGGRNVLDRVSLSVGPRSCLGVVGPNGVGKSSLLQILAGLLKPDGGVVTLEPSRATVGYLAQEHDRPSGEHVRAALARRTGVAQAELDLRSSAADLSSASPEAHRRYDLALHRFDALGAGTFDVRLETVLGELGVGEVVDWEVSSLSGGQEAKVALAAIELSNFDVVLLDEPTNDLDFAGLDRLERWLRARRGATVVVSHDRAFLERTVTSVLELNEHDHRGQEFGGGWSGYQAEKANAQRLAREAYEEYQQKKDQLSSRAARQRQWAESGVKKEVKNASDHDTAQRDFRINRTEKLASKARQTDRALERLAVVAKPFEGWNLHFSIDEAPRAGDVVVRLSGAVIERGAFRLGPVDLELAWGDRLVLEGANGAGKSTLIHALIGSLELSTGSRWIGPSVIVGLLGQDRRKLQGVDDLVRYVSDRCGLDQSATRSLLAKFGLGASHVTRPASMLSPGERTRAELAIFQALGVNFLVLDEPTNHLDLPAIEQLEEALRGYRGTMVLTSHDRRFLETVSVSRRVAMESGVAIEQR